MSRSLLLGRAGAGKTHTCLGLLTDALARDERPLCLVPTYGQAEHLRNLLLNRAGGLSQRMVHTFTSLAEIVSHQRLGRMVSHAVRDRTAEAVLRDFFPQAAGQPGFRAEFLQVVKEIKEQGLVPDEALQKARAHFGEGSRGRLLFEAYASYAHALPGQDHEDLLVRTRDILGDAPRIDLFLVDGFHDFTEVQRRILDLVADKAARTVITLPLDPANPADPIFGSAARTAASFVGYTREALPDNRRSTGALATLERSLFKKPDAPVDGSGIEVIGCLSDEDEADRLARVVVRAGRPFQDFLLLRRSFAGLHDLYRAAFARHGVPLRFFGSEALGRTPAALAVTLFLRHVVDALPLRDLLPLLRSPFLLDAPPTDEVDRLADLLRRKGEPENLDGFPGVRAHIDPVGGGFAQEVRRRFGVRDALIAQPDGDEDLARAGRFFRALGEELEALGSLSTDEAAERLLRRIPLLKGAPPDRRHACVYAVEAMSKSILEMIAI